MSLEVDVTRSGGVNPARGERQTSAPSGRGGRWLGLVLPLVVLGLWQAAATFEWVPPSQLPLPADVFTAMVELARSGELGQHVAISVQRVLLGFGIGAVAALVVGVAVATSGVGDRLLSPTLAAVRAVPSLAWVPLMVLWAGISETPKVAICAIGAFFPVLATLVSGLRSIDRQWLEVGRAYGLNRWQQIRTVMLPAAAAPMMSGLRLGLAQAWLFLVAAELVSSSMGLGFLLINSQNVGRVELVIGTVILLALIGTLCDAVLAAAERRVVARTR